jgi:glycosyltransferase involved in cell wall biosynthesis
LALRALLIGPVFPPDLVGGLQLALRGVIEQLRARGWRVDDRIWDTPAVPWRNTFLVPRSAAVKRPLWLQTAWIDRAPVVVREMVSTLCMPSAHFAASSRNLQVTEALLAGARDYDVVLLCVDGAPPGMSAMVAETAARAVFISLSGLARELRAAWWPWARALAHARLRERPHPFLFRRLAPAQAPMTIFASARWQADAERAGLPHHARTIYFGVPISDPPPRPVPAGNRLLWIGRLSFEKGLHLLLGALPALRRRVPGASVTVIAGHGPDAYRRSIEQMIRRHGLETAVTIRGPVERAALQELYATHDVLFFHSVFEDPVALVLMEAFAAGLPVVASRAAPGAGLVRDGVTCLCFEPGAPDSLVEALATMLTDARVRERVAAEAQRLVRRQFSLTAMGHAYDRTLREFVEGLDRTASMPS